jgi:tetratricopeptide (TPR) repeat protein
VIVLVEQGRFDEACAAAEPRGWSGPLPTILRGRRCWIDAQRGKHEQAITGMRQVLTNHPDYYWGWQRLADWCEATGDRAGNVDASRELLRLQPHSATAHGYLAAALLAQGGRTEAKTLFRRSIELDPEYNYGVVNAFDLCLEDGDLDPAEKALSLLRATLGADDEAVRARAVELAAARGLSDEARTHFAVLSRTVVGQPVLHRRALDALRKAGLAAEANETLTSLLYDPNAQPGIGLVWTQASLAQSGWHLRLWRVLGRRLGPAGVEMVADLIETASEERRALLLWLRLIGMRSELRRHGRIWGALGFALVRLNVKRCITFMRDWRTRSDAKPWMLNNLAMGYEALGALAKSHQVRLKALALEPDHSVTRHACWGAVGLAQEGNVEAARELLARHPREQLEPDRQALADLATLLLRAHAGAGLADPAARQAELAAVDAEIRALVGRPAYADTSGFDVACRRARRSVCWRMGVLAGLWTYAKNTWQSM